MNVRTLLALPLLLAATAANAAEPSRLEYTIEVAPGTQRLQPELSLVYEKSSNANGVVGKGWSLNLSRIERSTAKGVPRYEPTDTFLLDGEALVPAGPNLFTLKSNPAVRVANLGASWTVEYPDGTMRWYGSRSDATIAENGRTFAWLVSEIRERTSSDVVNYQYDASERGQRHPVSIDYRDDAGVDNQKISFAFGPRPDPRVSFAVGFEQRLERKLERVLVEGSVRHRYELRHVQSWDNMATLLESISHFEPAVSPVPELTGFRYSSNEAQPNAFAEARLDLDPAVSFVTRGSFDAGVRIGDVNGDGRADLVRAFVDAQSPASASRNGVYLNTPQGFQLDPRFTLPKVIDMGSGGVSRPFVFSVLGYRGNTPSATSQDGFTLVDATGDGRADLLRAIDYVIGDNACLEPAPVPILGRRNVSQFFPGTASGWTMPVPNPGSDGFATALHTSAAGGVPAVAIGRGSALADLNGDRLPDLVQSELLVSSGRANALDATWLNQGLGSFVRQPLGPTSVCVATGIGCGSFATIIAKAGVGCGPTRPNATLIDGQRRGKDYFDVNGDGLADFVSALRDANSEVRSVVLNTGGRFDTKPSPAFFLPQDVFLDEFQGDVRMERGLRMFDVNGDGIRDIVQKDETGAERVLLGTQIAGMQYLERTPSFRVPSGLAFGGAVQSDRGVRDMDVDADGVADLIRLDESALGGRRLFINQSVVPDRVTEVVGPIDVIE